MTGLAPVERSIMVTIKEIAKAVGVSATTVSRVLNYDETLSVSPTKRQAIIETAESLNYSTPRNRGKASAVAQAMDRLAIVHFLQPEEEFADPYYVGVRLGIERKCRTARFETEKFYPGEIAPDPEFLARAAGVIIIGRHPVEDVERVARINPNIVFADHTPPNEAFDSVHSDLYRATIRLLDALWEAGYRRFAFFGVLECVVTVPSTDRRWPAYTDWTRARGLNDPHSCLLGDLRVGSGYNLTKTLLSRPELPEIIICSNDNMAIGAYRALAERGLRVPDDIGVVGFNDIPVAQFLNPPLSSVKIRAEQIGETAVDLLVERIGGRDFVKQINISTEMVWRGSCRRPI